PRATTGSRAPPGGGRRSRRERGAAATLGRGGARRDGATPAPPGSAAARSCERVRRRTLERRERDTVVDERLHLVRLGARQRGLGVRELDDAARAGGVAAFGELEVLARLPAALVRDADALDPLTHVGHRLSHLERDVLTDRGLVRFEDRQVGARLADLRR